MATNTDTTVNMNEAREPLCQTNKTTDQIETSRIILPRLSVAIKKRNYDEIRNILNDVNDIGKILKEANMNQLFEGTNPLILLIRYAKAEDDDLKEFTECVKLLILKNINLKFDIGVNGHKKNALSYATERNMVKTTDLIDASLKIMEVAKHGEDEKIIPLLERGAVVNTEVLCSILKYFDRKDHKFQSCYKIVMDHLKEKEANNIYTILNGQDKQSNPPLHYAIRYADSATQEDLLKYGASLGRTNHMGKMLIEYIKPSILEKHLNNCVQNKLCDTNVVLQIDYRFLAPPTKITTNETEQHTDDVEPGTTTTDVIYYMSTSTRLKHLIRHPVIATFLLRKWENWNNIFIINIIVYVCFLVPIIIFVILNITPIILIISLVLLLLREGCEYIGTKTSYLERYDNLLELLISIMLILMVFLQLIYEGEIQLSSILILLAAFEFMIVLSIAPNCSTNMAIFSTVLVNYFIFLLWYSVLLIAFTYSFYSLFECQNTSFVNLTESFFKIIIMMTGELDAGNIKFDMHPLIGKTIFALFIFMIPIVLLNLLNGLAINDIQIIKQNAELTGYATLAYNIQIAETLIYKYKINCIKKLFFKEVKPIFDNTYQLTVNENKGSNDNQSKHSWWVFWKNPVGIEIMELVQTQNEKQGLDIDIIDIRKTLSEILSVLKPPFQNSCNLGERPTLQAGSQGPVHEPDPQAGPSGVCGAYNI